MMRNSAVGICIYSPTISHISKQEFWKADLSFSYSPGPQRSFWIEEHTDPAALLKVYCCYTFVLVVFVWNENWFRIAQEQY